ncbi:ABC transporter substrate-binding protein [Amphibacillus sp. MSJ-3]|uniref:ABC transporter substrate-binding protein n=1 Tax=Amphibacillus sp. MSJ-3 TaxID=2841505 RepID=UPI001C0F161B|nr:ABC transporter substrate-binding protein [Amphibacillus sp. MSJ-3]MBU5594326.1 ABC transporter substrate-binding protein [Amphibacillus sp. MSJ-3]
MEKAPLFLLLSIVFLTNCTSPNEQSEINTTPVIGFSQSGTESSWRKAHTDSIITELEKENYQVLYRNGFLDQERQIQDLRRFIAYKVDLIILAPLIDSGWDEVLAEAKAAGIPVITVDRSIQTKQADLYMAHIGPSFKAEGNRAGLYLSNHYSEQSLAEIRVFELAGLDQASSTTLRQEGFLETIGRDPRIQIVQTAHGDFIRSKGKEVIRAAIQAGDFSNIHVLYSHSDEMTLGAIEAFLELAPEILEELVIISIDGQKEMIDLLKDGLVNAVVECNPHAGWYVQNTITRYLNGHTIPKEIYIPETIFSDQGDLSMIPTRNY